MRYIGIKYVHGRKEDLLINTYSWEFCEAMIIIFLIIGVQVQGFFNFHVVKLRRISKLGQILR